VTMMTALLTATRDSHVGATATMAVLGLAIGLTIVPQQHRLFAAVPTLAPVAVGLNGSAIYIGTALGAGLGGLVLAAGGSAAPTIAACGVGVLAIIVAVTAARRM
jgi:MFS transporter, DHA1 family, inner membrane transport protein